MIELALEVISAVLVSGLIGIFVTLTDDICEGSGGHGLPFVITAIIVPAAIAILVLSFQNPVITVFGVRFA